MKQPKQGSQMKLKLTLLFFLFLPWQSGSPRHWMFLSSDLICMLCLTTPLPHSASPSTTCTTSSDRRGPSDSNAANLWAFYLVTALEILAQIHKHLIHNSLQILTLMSFWEGVFPNVLHVSGNCNCLHILLALKHCTHGEMWLEVRCWGLMLPAACNALPRQLE